MLNLNCVICMGLFNSSDDVHVTTCGHMFHFTCIRQWMDRSKSCPQCRIKCTDGNIFRIYFNLDASHIDVGSLQEQLDDAKLQIKVKEKDLNKAAQDIKNLKEVQKMCTKTISSLEQKLKKSDFLILTYSEQMQLLKQDAKVAKTLSNEIELLKQQIKQMETVSSVVMASTAEVEKLLKCENDPQRLCAMVTTLKRELRNCESKKADLRKVLRLTQDNLRKEADIRKTHEERISQLESENYQLREKGKKKEKGAGTCLRLRCYHCQEMFTAMLTFMGHVKQHRELYDENYPFAEEEQEDEEQEVTNVFENRENLVSVHTEEKLLADEMKKVCGNSEQLLEQEVIANGKNELQLAAKTENAIGNLQSPKQGGALSAVELVDCTAEVLDSREYGENSFKISSEIKRKSNESLNLMKKSAALPVNPYKKRKTLLHQATNKENQPKNPGCDISDVTASNKQLASNNTLPKILSVDVLNRGHVSQSAKI